MGMFDTFVGDVVCPYCGELHEFQEQTKGYDCLLSEFYMGDYIDKGNANYIYTFDWFCDKDNSKVFDVGIAIRKGQIVKFLVNEEIEELKNSPLEVLDNIEDGLGKRLLYEKVCKEANGQPREELKFELNPLPEGFKFVAFGVEWEVIKLYRQKKGFRGLAYYYEIKSKEHGLRIMESYEHTWYGDQISIITLEDAEKYKSVYFD